MDWFPVGIIDVGGCSPRSGLVQLFFLRSAPFGRCDKKSLYYIFDSITPIGCYAV
jgi:hypothetical protein